MTPLPDDFEWREPLPETVEIGGLVFTRQGTFPRDWLESGPLTLEPGVAKPRGQSLFWRSFIKIDDKTHLRGEGRSEREALRDARKRGSMMIEVLRQQSGKLLDEAKLLEQTLEKLPF